MIKSLSYLIIILFSCSAFAANLQGGIICTKNCKTEALACAAKANKSFTICIGNVRHIPEDVNKCNSKAKEEIDRCSSDFNSCANNCTAKKSGVLGI